MIALVLILVGATLVGWAVVTAYRADERVDETLATAQNLRRAAREVAASRGQNQSTVAAWREVWPTPSMDPSPTPDPAPPDE